MQAKYGGVCHACGQRYEAGETITRLPQGWGHEACKPARKEPEYPTAGGLPVLRLTSSGVSCQYKRCPRHGHMDYGDEYVCEISGGLFPRTRTYHPACWEAFLRGKRYAQECERARAIGYDSPAQMYAARRERTAQEQAEAGERAHNRYWGRVDNYRELGYDPN